MQITDYFSETAGIIQFTREQASRFAKGVAGDYNPIHDPDAKRFCVPGDLLFAVVLAHYGLSQQMCFTFAGMVTEGVSLVFPDPANAPLSIADSNGKEYLRVERDGEISRDTKLIETLTRGYVAFSGQTFPHILVPLMAERNVMINPDRPLIIYERMSLDLEHLDLSNPTLELADARLEVDGKRGDVTLDFRLIDAGRTVGTGAKHMVLSGLRAYDATSMDAVVYDYNLRKAAAA